MKILSFQCSSIQKCLIRHQEDIDELRDQLFGYDDGTMLRRYSVLKRESQNPNQLHMLTKDVRMRVETKKYIIHAVFKKGYPTDWGSVPSWARSLVGNTGTEYDAPYLLHDGWYGTDMGRRLGDLLLEGLLDYKDVAFWIPGSVYWAVRFGGKNAYNNTMYAKSWEDQFVDITIIKK